MFTHNYILFLLLLQAPHAPQSRCDTEVEIVTFVVNGSEQLTVNPDRQKKEAEVLLSLVSLISSSAG